MLTIDINNDVLKKIIIKYYEMCGIKAIDVRFDTKEYYSEDINTNFIVDTVINVMGEDVNTTTIIDNEILHEIVCFALPHVEVNKIEENYETEYYRNEGIKKFCGLKVKAKMNNKKLVKECDLNGN